MRLYVLGGPDGKTPVLCDDVLQWGRTFAHNESRVVAQEVVNGVLVSTVFLGIDHNFSRKGPPIVFESMVFLPSEDWQVQDRYSTWADALAGHQRLSRTVREWAAEAGEMTSATLRQAMATRSQ